MKADVQQYVEQQAVIFNIYTSVVPEYLTTYEQALQIERSLKKGLVRTMTDDPDVIKTPLVIVDCGWDGKCAERYKAKRKTFHIEVYFLPKQQNLPWKKLREVAREILKGVEATLLRILLDNNQVIVPYK